jgi:alanine dehydrogenase
MVEKMKPGSVIVDVAIDQGGSVDTITHYTTHDHPTFIKYGVNHYAVANMPGATSRTATAALVNATTPYALAIAKNGIRSALKCPTIYSGINTIDGHLTMKPVADALHIKYEEAKKYI